jgi:hypothetical protein
MAEYLILKDADSGEVLEAYEFKNLRDRDLYVANRNFTNINQFTVSNLSFLEEKDKEIVCQILNEKENEEIQRSSYKEDVKREQAAKKLVDAIDIYGSLESLYQSMVKPSSKSSEKLDMYYKRTKEKPVGYNTYYDPAIKKHYTQEDARDDYYSTSLKVDSKINNKEEAIIIIRELADYLAQEECKKDNAFFNIEVDKDKYAKSYTKYLKTILKFKKTNG